MPKLPQPDPRQIQAVRALEQALAHQRMGQFSEAADVYARMVKKNPGFFDALNLFGVFRLQQGQPQEAVSLLTKATAVNPRSANAFNNLGIALGMMRRDQDALAAFDRALAIDPQHTRALGNRGNVLANLNRPQEALASLDRAIALDPRDVDALNNRGRVLFGLGRYDEALVSYDAVLAVAPGRAEIHSNRGAVLQKLERLDEALAGHDRALASNPRNVEAHNNRGSVLQDLGRYVEALEAHRRALALDPNNANAYHNAGIALHYLGRSDEALASYSRAIALQPGYADPRWNRSLVNLSLERFAEGWVDFESRWAAVPDQRYRDYQQPRWNGAPVKGTLLSWADAGLGDEILFASMAGDLRRHADKVVLELDARLVPLFTRALPDVEVIARGKELYGGRVDAQIPLSSLGPYLRKSPAEFPQRRCYLSADPERTAALRQRLAGDGQFVIGLSWSSKNVKFGKAKSLSLADLVSLMPVSGVRMVDLQYGDTTAERAAVERESGVRIEHLPDIDNTHDIDGLAALVSACDMVVTVSNTTAHLAGALGRPTWVLMSRGHSRFWYWFTDREDSLWYRDVRLFRQRTPGDWAPVLARVRDELAKRVVAR
jgi:tetratricopeptide (TPR) repeat protein